MTRTASVDEVAALLGEVFPDAPRLADSAYIEWLYEASPIGPVLQRNRFDGDGLAAHYALVPVDLSIDGTNASGALSLNTAVHERARGGGTFVALASETIRDAQEQGISCVVGVANANSTPGFERRLDFLNRGPLPVQILAPTPGRSGFSSAWAADAATLLSGIEPMLTPSSHGLSRTWTPAALRWRLETPGARYAVHRTDEALAISIAAPLTTGARLAIILGIFAEADLSAKKVRQLVRACCVFHKAPLAVHAGFNDRAVLRGLPLPARLRPSPLNLITRSLDSTVVPAPARFEFIDFDAY